MNRVLTIAPKLDEVMNAMLIALKTYLPPNSDPLPPATVSVASMAEEQVGIGRIIGTASIQSPLSSPTGVRLNALARFQIWGGDSNVADQTIGNLNQQLMANREGLRSSGFLRFALESSPPAKPFLDSVGGWRRYADYRVLFEFKYQDSNDAQGLITRIPVNIDGQLSQFMAITGDLTMWTNRAAPPLNVRGPDAIGGLSLLAFVPGPLPSGTVTLTRTYDNAQGPPASYASLPGFIAAISGPKPKSKHATLTFQNFAAFRASFKISGDATDLGDWDHNGIPDTYKQLALVIDTQIELLSLGDRFSVVYNTPRFDKLAVVYVGATH